jgi:hypothetical protein
MANILEGHFVNSVKFNDGIEPSRIILTKIRNNQHPLLVASHLVASHNQHPLLVADLFEFLACQGCMGQLELVHRLEDSKSRAASIKNERGGGTFLSSLSAAAAVAGRETRLGD